MASMAKKVDPREAAAKKAAEEATKKALADRKAREAADRKAAEMAEALKAAQKKEAKEVSGNWKYRGGDRILFSVGDAGFIQDLKSA